MNRSHGNLRIMRRIICLALLLMAAFYAPPDALAQQSSKSHILILNSYDESSPWVQEYINGLTYHLVNVKGVSTNVRHINASEIVNDSTFEAAISSNLNYFADNPPSGIILMGRPAFAAREEINRRWKNIPMLYMGATEEVIPKEYEYVGVDISDAPVVSIHDIRDRYNFTFVKIPDHYRKTIDMMMKMQPDMKNFKFASNSLTTSIQLRDSVHHYLMKKFPKVSFEWINADEESGSEKFKSLLAKRDLETGILLGNWYHKEFDQAGHPIYSAGDVNLIDKSPQPVFTVKENYFKTGVIGGVLPIRTEIMKRSKEVIDRMLKGDDMRQIPLDKGEPGGASIDFPQLERKGMQDADIPAGTSFINKPESLFSKNPLAFAVALLILISLVQLVMYYLLFKGKTESFMKRREIKINHLPVNYFIGKVKYNEDGVPVEIETTPGNQKAIELWERHAGECRCEPLFNDAEMLKAVARLSEDGKGVVYTEHFTKTDSYYEVNIHRGFDADTLEIFCFNITRRMQSEQNLKYTSAVLELTLELAQVVPWHWNLEEKKIELIYNEALRKVNRNLVSHNGKDLVIPEDLLMRLIHPEDLAKVNELTKEVIEGKRKYAQMEFRIIIPDGGRKIEEWLEVNESVERYGSDGKAEVLIGSFTCITERKEQMRRLIEARETAKEADRLKSAFLANMSHEIRTPLNAIVGFSNMLAETDDPAQKAKFINIIESNNEMLLQIISDILDLSKTEAGTMEFNMRPTDINALLVNIGESVVDRVKPGVDLLCNFGAQSCWLYTDPNRLSQVVINFLTNASKFTENGSISYGYDVHGDNLYFYCHDTGSGISEENQKKVFERFIKLNSFVNGTGLGLPICKAIVEFLGGQIGVSSEGEGFGSTFWFEIPYRMAEIPDDVEAPIWTEPSIDMTMQHAMSMPADHHSEFEQPDANNIHDSMPQQQFVPDVMPQYPPQFGLDGVPQYPPQFGPDGVPQYPPQFGPDGIPQYPPQFGPDGMPQYTPPPAPYGMPPFPPQFGPDGMPANPEPSDISDCSDHSDHSAPPADDQIPLSSEEDSVDIPEAENTVEEVEPAEIDIEVEVSDQEDIIEEEIESSTENNTQESEDMSQQMNPNQSNNPYNQGYHPNGQPVDPRYQQYPNGQNPNGQNPYGQNPYGQNPYGQNPYGQNPYGQNPYGQNPYAQQYQQNPYGQPNPQQAPQQNPYGQLNPQQEQQNTYGRPNPQQELQQNPSAQSDSQQAPQQNPYGQQNSQQAPQQNPYAQPYQQNPYGQQYYGQQYPPYNPYGQPYPQQNPYGQQYPQQNPYGRQYPQQNPYGQHVPQQDPYGQHAPQQDPYGQHAPQQDPYGKQFPQQNYYEQPQMPQNPQQTQQPAQPQNSFNQQKTRQNPFGHHQFPPQQGAQPSQGSPWQHSNQHKAEVGQPQGQHLSNPGPSHSEVSNSTSAESADPDEKKLKVLIAEDNESNYILYESMLAGNYELIHAWDGEEAVELFEQTKPDIILMDISMPKMDGYEATTEIKRKDSNVPIIAVTAYAFATDKERMLESGFNGYVSKPINSTRLKEEMSHVLNRR